ncbi:hypothetical protein HY491_01695 [Candidatus Woesearchaeota archaeon]|nr:hypothetical protein [Candidatus Woesearchaeota archaeon]
MSLEQRVLVPVADFMATFGERDYGLAYLDYRRQLNALLGQDESYPAIIPGMAEVSPRTRGHWQQGKHMPKSVHALQRLQEIGVSFPITYGSRQLLTVWSLTQFSGYIDKKYNISIHLQPNIQEYMKQKIAPICLSDFCGRPHIHRLSGGDSLGRAISCVSGRTMHEVKEMIERRQMSEEDTEFAYALLFSYIEDLLLTRGNPYIKNDRLVVHTKFRSQLDEADGLKRLLEFCFQEEFAATVNKRRKNDGKYTALNIYISKKKLARIQEKYRARVHLDAILQ